jgi:hypothetical protein
MCVYAVEAIIYFQREEIQKEKKKENIIMVRLHGNGRRKRILAAKVKPEANEIHEDGTDV